MTDGRDDGFNEPPGSSGGPRHDEDALWREIVEHYGDEPKVEDFPTDDAAPATPADRFPSLRGLQQPQAEEEPEPEEDEGFHPPPPPPVPRPRGLRAVAWAGIFGVPALVLVLLLAAVSLPSWAGVLCLGWFVGGFGYLVATMRKGPGDWDDDGARL